VTVLRGADERRVPILKERTERDRERERGRGREAKTRKGEAIGTGWGRNANKIQNQIYVYRKLPDAKTNARSTPALDPKDSETALRFKLRLRPGGESERPHFSRWEERKGLSAKPGGHK